MTRFHSVVLMTAALTCVALSAGQTAASKFHSLDFLSGRWISDSAAEMQEENWSPVSGDSMIGSFRILHSGKPVFYEFWVVETDAGQLILKLKHFNANLAGWEEKNDSTRMPLVSSSEADATFAEPGGSVSLHYHRTGDQLTCVVHHVRDGKADDETFRLKKAPSL